MISIPKYLLQKKPLENLMNLRENYIKARKCKNILNLNTLKIKIKKRINQ